MKFLSFINHKQLAAAVAEIVMFQIKNKPNTVLGLPTGSSPISTYQKLQQAYQNKLVFFSQVLSFNLDEYIGLNKEAYSDSYHAFMAHYLFKNTDFNPKNCFFPCNFYDKVDFKRDFSVYDQLIKQKNGLDLLLLGLGVNGHIGFNEPDSLLTSTTRLVQLTASTQQANAQYFANKQTPHYAVSMGLATILAAKRIILLVLGVKKKAVFKQLQAAKTFNAQIPVTALVQHPNVTVVYVASEMQ